MRNFISHGKSLTFTAAADYAAGRILKLGNIIGCVAKDVANGAQGELQFGVFTCPKVSGAVIAAGESLVWDISANTNTGAFDDNAASPATGDVSGAAAVAWEGAGNGVTSMAVLLTGVPGTVA